MQKRSTSKRLVMRMRIDELLVFHIPTCVLIFAAGYAELILVHVIVVCGAGAGTAAAAVVVIGFIPSVSSKQLPFCKNEKEQKIVKTKIYAASAIFTRVKTTQQTIRGRCKSNIVDTRFKFHRNVYEHFAQT